MATIEYINSGSSLLLFDPIFRLIIDIQDQLFAYPNSSVIKLDNQYTGPMCIFDENINNNVQLVYLNIDGNYPYQAAYQFAHEYSHIKMRFWLTFRKEKYKFKFFEEASAWCASIFTLLLISNSEIRCFAGRSFPQEYTKYAIKEIDKIQKFMPQDISLWIKNNFQILSTDFTSDNQPQEDNARLRSKILGLVLFNFSYVKTDFWPLLGKITSVLTEHYKKTGDYPSSMKNFFTVLKNYCSEKHSDTLKNLQTILCI